MFWKTKKTPPCSHNPTWYDRESIVHRVAKNVLEDFSKMFASNVPRKYKVGSLVCMDSDEHCNPSCYGFPPRDRFDAQTQYVVTEVLENPDTSKVYDFLSYHLNQKDTYDEVKSKAELEKIMRSYVPEFPDYGLFWSVRVDNPKSNYFIPESFFMPASNRKAELQSELKKINAQGVKIQNALNKFKH